MSVVDVIRLVLCIGLGLGLVAVIVFILLYVLFHRSEAKQFKNMDH